MMYRDVRLALTESAMRLILHAEHDISMSNRREDIPGRISQTAFGVSNEPFQWRRELALLRIISTIEAYIDAVSIERISSQVPNINWVTEQMLGDFEVASGKTWQDRHETFNNYHRMSLRNLAGWQAVSAGIEVRNCLVHGLGNLTAQQRGKSNLALVVKMIDVTVSGNRMHLHAQTIPKFSHGCREFVEAVDEEMRPRV